MSLCGQCQCGAIKYKLKCIPIEIANCYCTICQKLHQTKFVSFARYLKKDIPFVKKENLIKNRTSNRATRSYCKKCGTYLFMHYNLSDNIWLYTNTFNFSTDMIEHYGIYKKI